MGTQSSRRYVGATPLTHFHAITADLKVTRRRTQASEDYAVLARRGNGVELLTQGDLHCAVSPQKVTCYCNTVGM